jgi:ribosomal protein L7Ae-like RNA K-turn-binding protein
MPQRKRRRLPGRRTRITGDALIDDGIAPGQSAGDADAEEPETGPLRRCAATRERLPKERMIRFVVGPDRRIAPDFAERLPGRGIWLSARRDVLETGRRDMRSDAGVAPRSTPKLAGFFARAARGPVTVPDDLADLLRRGLERRIAELLGLARRAGEAVAGFDKAREWIKAGRAGLVVQARDGSPDERVRFLAPETAARLGLTVAAPLDAATLGVVFGRERTVHVVVAPGKLAGLIGREAARLAGINGDPDKTSRDEAAPVAADADAAATDRQGDNGAETTSAPNGMGMTQR